MELDSCEYAPASWPRRTIGEVCKRFTSGGTPSRSKPEFYGGDIPWVKTKELTDGMLWSTEECITYAGLANSSAKLLPAGTILMAMYGATVGKLARLGREMACNQACAAMVVDTSQADASYLYFQLKLNRRRIVSSATGAAQQNLSGQQIKNFILPFPEVGEQTRIGNLLVSLDDKIELNRRMNETLEAMAQAIFRDWFVDFGPVRRKLAGETDPVAIMGGLTPDPAHAGELTALFPDAFDANDLPEGFELCCLEDTVSILETGRRPKGGIKGILTGVPSIGAESIVGLAKFDYGKTKYVPRDFFASMKRGVIGDRDIVLYKDGGRPGEFEPHVGMFGAGFPFEQCCINEHVYRVVGAPPFSQEYLYLHLSSDVSMAEMRNKGTGVAIPGLNSTAAKSLIILHPGEQLLDAFTGIVRPMIDAALHNANENRTLAETRDYLLPRLMSGQVRVTAHTESAAA